jgi:ketosteroid isomerase-like protein
MVRVCDPEVEWHTLWPGLDSVYRGHDGVREWGYGFLEIFTDPGQEVIEVLELDSDRVLIHVRLFGVGRESGTPVEMTIHDLWTFRDGLLVHRLPFYERADAEAAAGLR